MLRILPDGRIQRRDHGGKKVDPLYEMFIPSRSGSPRGNDHIILYIYISISILKLYTK